MECGMTDMIWDLFEDFAGKIEPDKVHFLMLSAINYAHHIINSAVELMNAPHPPKTPWELKFVCCYLTVW